MAAATAIDALRRALRRAYLLRGQMQLCGQPEQQQRTFRFMRLASRFMIPMSVPSCDRVAS
jgi:hypothetical protein